MPTAGAGRFANEANSLCAKLYQRCLSRSWPALFSSSLSLLALSLFSSPGDFSPPNKIQSERIAEGNIRSYVWRLVKERKDDEHVCVCVNKYAYTVALC